MIKLEQGEYDVKFCRYDKNTNTDKCKGCDKGCLSKRPVAYINKEFEDAVKEMEQDDRCRGNEKAKSKTDAFEKTYS